MGACTSKPLTVADTSPEPPENDKKSPLFFPFYTPSPARFPATPERFFRRPPSPAKHIKAVLARRQGGERKGEERESGGGGGLDKGFGFSKGIGGKYEVGFEEVIGRGHFGYTCKASFKKGEFKGKQVAVKVIPKSKMTTAIAIEDVRREVKMLRALTGHKNLVQFYNAYEDHENVYIVME